MFVKVNTVWWALLGSALLFLVALAFHVPTAAAQGVGIFPTSVEYEDTLREGEYFRSLGVINGGDAERVFSFEPAGEIAGWITIVDTDDRTKELETITAAPNSQARVLVRLRVPQDAPNGTFRGVVRVVAISSAPQTGGAGSTVNIGAEVLVEATVGGTQVIDGALLDASINQVELGSPLRIKSTVQNSGNVRVEPQMTLEVLDSEGNTIFHEAFLQESVFSSETGTLVAEWDTTGQELGDYTAKASVTFGDFDLGEREFNFTILPFGTLTRQGELRELDLRLNPEPNDLGIVHAVFQNTGQIDTLAKFTGEFYFGEKLIDVLTSDEVLVLVGEQKRLVVFPRAGEAGEYSIRGKVNFQGKETEVLELNFTVAAVIATPGEATTTVEGATTPPGAATSEGTRVPERTTPPAGTASETPTSNQGTDDGGGVGTGLWIVIAVAAIAALAVIIFVGRKSIPGLRPSR